MIDGLKALIALESVGTLSESALRLRVTQSALSKRIQSLENELGYQVVERHGRRLKLTDMGVKLLSKAQPLLLELEGLKDIDESSTLRPMAIGISDSIASSWGPKLIKNSLKKVKELTLNLHVHRSTMVLEQIRSGRYELGIVTGKPQGTDLIWSLLAEEPMVVVSQGAHSKFSNVLLCIETNSATWKEIGSIVIGHPETREKELVFVESFSAAIQMAKEGFGQAIVPLGLALAYSLKHNEFATLSPRIKRHIYLVKRKSNSELSSVKLLSKTLRDNLNESL